MSIIFQWKCNTYVEILKSKVKKHELDYKLFEIKQNTKLFTKMSAATKKKHVFQETINNYTLPNENQSIVRVSYNVIS